MRRLYSASSVLLLFVLLVSSACTTDYDIAEVAPEEHLNSDSDEHAGHDHAPGEPCTESEHADITSNHETSTIDEEREAAHSGHAHGAGNRNHGTQWFFNQPWAAPFIWGKLLRDSLIFLILAVGIFLLTGGRRKR